MGEAQPHPTGHDRAKREDDPPVPEGVDPRRLHTDPEHDEGEEPPPPDPAERGDIA